MRLTKWGIDFLDFDVSFKARKALKAQIFSIFIAQVSFVRLDPTSTWVIFTEESSHNRGSGANVILENGYDLIIDVSLRFESSDINNQVEYEVVIAEITPT